MFSFRNFATAAVLAATAGVASAAPVSILFNSGGGNIEGQTLDYFGVDLTFTSIGSGGGHAYLDGAKFNGEIGGLGVCNLVSMPLGGSCDEFSGSDNIDPGNTNNPDDAVTITFNRTVDISNIIYLNNDHSVSAVAYGSNSGTDEVTSITFTADSGDKFYIGGFDLNVVPLPAGGLLLLTALGGLGIARRRKTA